MQLLRRLLKPKSFYFLQHLARKNNNRKVLVVDILTHFYNPSITYNRYIPQSYLDPYHYVGDPENNLILIS